jgi:hypothetical protein
MYLPRAQLGVQSLTFRTPADTFRQLRRSLRETLPGTRISRLLMGRYLIIWHAPG